MSDEARARSVGRAQLVASLCAELAEANFPGDNAAMNAEAICYLVGAISMFAANCTRPADVLRMVGNQLIKKAELAEEARVS